MPVTWPIRTVRQKAEDVMQAALLGVIRHVLTAAGGALVANGALTGDEVNTAVGAISALVGVMWSVLSKRQWWR